MFDASKVDGLEAVSRSMAEEAGRTLDKFKVLGESSAMKAVGCCKSLPQACLLLR